ncbi:putative flippase GtrA (transmembrane translocase of bactoprenol-linked glucose) [Streptoalloteichus tenebrarius]|uniref:Flippase GtrA (Transmembrane translocase of bactoprenol-linked glucose) n=1 Tax=Streptoalloteichus tenebrarius (strain ATCC 17920 / DSM 40477 / JCM 4838 / CBS 697.72 / NBRC 16177 / NCIMB 11028 / NRRL B-12390 / A12253. 1 / ISP 5477) TaxID=1933 RepID=A0ABT1HRK3_STRSD|nr:GtrA family protein [Streptoalloteichus tenebrarius]MCP2258112.1 putative flippase GtrA (transmembrane translocase of bactoprenol-linked glucose) [Streptoalloteichus tenebrarius]BFF01786.1 hypothetical protein GCM10020241_34610 [Streptoalloteichus tenebrarius]
MSQSTGTGATRLARMLRFGAVGVVNTGVYYGLYLLSRTVIPYLAAHVLAFVLAMVGSYFLNCYFTFRTRPTLRKFLLFPLSNLTNFVVQTVGLYLLVDVLGTNERIAPLLAAAAAIPITFLVAQFVLVDRAATRPAPGAAPPPAAPAAEGPPAAEGRRAAPDRRLPDEEVEKTQ